MTRQPSLLESIDMATYRQLDENDFVLVENDHSFCDDESYDRCDSSWLSVESLSFCSEPLLEGFESGSFDWGENGSYRSLHSTRNPELPDVQENMLLPQLVDDTDDDDTNHHGVSNTNRLILYEPGRNGHPGKDHKIDRIMSESSPPRADPDVPIAPLPPKSRRSNKKRRKALMRKAAAVSAAAAALRIATSTTPQPPPQTKMVGSKARKLRSKQRVGNVAVACATESLAAFRLEVQASRNAKKKSRICSSP